MKTSNLWLGVLWTSMALGSDLPIILVDPGHGGRDPGAVVGSVYEKDLNLAIASLVKIEGFDVKMTRTDDTFISLADRKAMSDRLMPDLFVSIHCDAHTTTTPSGFTIFIEPKAFRKTQAAADEIRNSLKKTGSRDRGIKKARFRVLTGKAPSILVETGFMTNTQELADLTRPLHQALVAKCIGDGIRAWYSAMLGDVADAITQRPTSRR